MTTVADRLMREQYAALLRLRIDVLRLEIRLLERITRMELFMRERENKENDK